MPCFSKPPLNILTMFAWRSLVRAQMLCKVHSNLCSQRRKRASSLGPSKPIFPLQLAGNVLQFR